MLFPAWYALSAAALVVADHSSEGTLTSTLTFTVTKVRGEDDPQSDKPAEPHASVDRVEGPDADDDDFKFDDDDFNLDDAELDELMASWASAGSKLNVLAPTNGSYAQTSFSASASTTRPSKASSATASKAASSARTTPAPARSLTVGLSDFDSMTRTRAPLASAASNSTATSLTDSVNVGSTMACAAAGIFALVVAQLI